MIMIMIIIIMMIMIMILEGPAEDPASGAPLSDTAFLAPSCVYVIGKGQNGVSTNGVGASFMFFDRDLLGTPVNLLLYSQK